MWWRVDELRSRLAYQLHNLQQSAYLCVMCTMFASLDIRCCHSRMESTECQFDYSISLLVIQSFVQHFEELHISVSVQTRAGPGRHGFCRIFPMKMSIDSSNSLSNIVCERFENPINWRCPLCDFFRQTSAISFGLYSWIFNDGVFLLDVRFISSIISLWWGWDNEKNALLYCI